MSYLVSGYLDVLMSILINAKVLEFQLYIAPLLGHFLFEIYTKFVFSCGKTIML